MGEKQVLSVIYCNEICIKDKSDILCTFTFIYRAVLKVCSLTNVLRRRRVNLSFYHWSDIIVEFHSRGIIYDHIYLHKSLNKITKFNFLFIGSFFVVVSLSEQIVAVVLHCLALFNLVAFLDSSGSSWEELVLVRVHYLIVGSALPQYFMVEGSMNFLLPHPFSIFSADYYDVVEVVC